jgi:hypothetical protein
LIGLLLITFTIGGSDRAAAEVAAEYLANGPAALYERLSLDAPLRALPRQDALAEIAVRTGPREGATWTLQTTSGGRAGDVAFRVTFPSGYEDGLLLRMKGGSLQEVLTLAEDPMRRRAPPPPRRRAPLHSALVAAAFVLTIVATLIVRRTRVIAVIALLLGAVAFFLALVIPRPAQSQRSLAFQELRSLLPVREALARGDKPLLSPNLDAPTRDVALLWILQSGATATVPPNWLMALPRSPLAEVIRARIALTNGRTADAKSAFTRALAIQPWRDDIAFEALPLLDDVRGSRDPRLHYARAIRDASPDALRVAWSLAPVPREQLVREPRLLPLLRDARMIAMVSLYATEEPAPRSPQLGSAPLSWPSNARALATGGFLRVEIGNAALEIPGGAALAPPNARLVPARAAATRNTNALVLRIRELLRNDRSAEARALAESAQDPSTILAVADAIANDRASGDTAEKLYRSVKADDRLRHLALRRTLATNGITIATPHFDVRHDPAMNPAIAARIGELLEAELARVQQKLATKPPRRVAVNVIYWDDFRQGIPGGDHILGLYDGEILLPFAVVNQFKPELVAIITHELTHAVIAQATSDHAPRWFQEGVAQRMELVPQHDNAFHETNPELVLPLALLDAVMENTADLALTKDGYRVSQTFIRFLESRHPDAVATLVAAFAAGKNSDEAITALTGKSLDALTRDFRAWGFANSANFTNDEPWPYRDLYSPGVDPRIKAGFQWSKRPR